MIENVGVVFSEDAHGWQQPGLGSCYIDLSFVIINGARYDKADIIRDGLDLEIQDGVYYNILIEIAVLVL